MQKYSEHFHWVLPQLLKYLISPQPSQQVPSLSSSPMSAMIFTASKTWQVNFPINVALTKEPVHIRSCCTADHN